MVAVMSLPCGPIPDRGSESHSRVLDPTSRHDHSVLLADCSSARQISFSESSDHSLPVRHGLTLSQFFPLSFSDFSCKVAFVENFATPHRFPDELGSREE